jgi:hypothetical protein
LSQINCSIFLPKTHENARAEETRKDVRVPSLPEEVLHQGAAELSQQNTQEKPFECEMCGHRVALKDLINNKELYAKRQKSLTLNNCFYVCFSPKQRK